MTYKIDQFVRKITSPVVVKLGDESLSFANGQVLSENDFDRPYIVSEITASEDSCIVIALIENDRINDTSWSDNDQIIFEV